MARLFLSAAHKSSGKTSVAIGLCAAWRELGLNVQPFKKGPDYIDPIWLTQASGRACRNLDFNTQSPSEITTLTGRFEAQADLALIEGNKGLHDGLNVEGGDSNAALAKLVQAPVILVLDTVGTTRGIAPLVLGYQAFDREVTIAGVILNKVGGPRHESKLRAALERYTDVPVLGALPRADALTIEERHLGLIPATETDGATPLIARLCAAVKDGVDLERLRRIAAQTSPLPVPATKTVKMGKSVRLGVARDRAFGFYYPDDLEALEAAGAEVVTFDTLQDTTLPPGLDGLFIGGGFPETHARELAANTSLRADILAAGRAGRPIYAECGGLMYLSRSLSWRGEKHPMVGLIQGDAVMHPTPQGRGYVALRESGNGPWSLLGKGQGFPAHEFHYASLENIDGDPIYAFTVERGKGISQQQDGLVVGNTVATFAHLRTTERLPWARRFIEFIRTAR